MVQGQEAFGIGGGLLPLHASTTDPTSGPRRGAFLSAHGEDPRPSPALRKGPDSVFAKLDDIVLGRLAFGDRDMGEMVIVNMVDGHLADTLAMEGGNIALR